MNETLNDVVYVLSDLKTSLHSIEQQLDLNSDYLVKAINDLKTEIRIASGSDFIEGRREVVMRIQSCEKMIDMCQRRMNDILEKNGDNYDNADIKTYVKRITGYNKEISELRNSHIIKTGA